MTDQCFICGESNQNVLQKHHIVPRRHGGSDQTNNLVDLCASCHQAIEKIYNKSFYDRLFSRYSEKTHQQNHDNCIYQCNNCDGHFHTDDLLKQGNTCPFCHKQSYAVVAELPSQSGENQKEGKPTKLTRKKPSSQRHQEVA